MLLWMPTSYSVGIFQGSDKAFYLLSRVSLMEFCIPIFVFAVGEGSFSDLCGAMLFMLHYFGL